MGRILVLSLLVISSFLPWWTLGVGTWHVSSGRHTFEVTHANAWEISTRWSIAIVLAALSLLLPRLWGSVGVLSAIGLVLWQWWEVTPFDRSGPGTWTTEVSFGKAEDSYTASWIVRDRLLSYDDPGLMVGVGRGLYAGLCAMLVCLVWTVIRYRVRA